MNELSIFKNIDENDIKTLLSSLGVRRISFQKDHIIFSHLVDDDLIGIMLSGTANIIKYACRWKKKNGIQDVEKIIWYATHLKNYLEKK